MSQYVTEIKNVPPLTESLVMELVLLKTQGDEDARNILITYYLRYAFSVACSFQRRIHESIEEMIGIGSEHVIKAVDNYKPGGEATLKTVVIAYLKTGFRKYIEFHSAQKRNKSYEVSFQNEMFEDGSEFGEILLSPEALPDNICFDAELSALINELLSLLPSRDEDTLRWRYGFNDGKFHTLEETGQILGLTSEGIRLRELKACRKLRHPAIKKGLQHFL